MQLFFNSASHSSATQSGTIELLFNTKTLENYYQFLKSRDYKPTTASEKLRQLKLAIQFLIHETNDSKDKLTFYVMGMHLINLLTQWTKSLSKVISVLRQKHGMKMNEKVKTTSDPYK